MIVIQCHWWSVQDILEYLMVYFKNFCEWRLHNKIDINGVGAFMDKVSGYGMKGQW